MLLDYASPPTPVLRTGMAFFAALCVVAFGSVATWCAVHAVAVVYALQHSPGPFFCAEGAQAWVASLGPPLERTIPLGILCGGVSLVAFVQCIRHMNVLRTYGHRRAA
jgi:hypothetical protein